MANARSSSDIIKGALGDAGETSNGTSRYHTKALRFLNQAYVAVLSGSNEFEIDFGDPWHWARDTDPGILMLEAPVTTGTVTFTNGSAAIVFSSAPAASVEGWFIKVDGRPTIYRIDAHTAASVNATLDSVYLEASGATAYTCFKLIYNLGQNILRLVEPLRHYRTDENLYEVSAEARDKIHSIELNRFRVEWPLTRVKQGIPDKFTILRQSESEFTVQLNRYPEEKMRVEYDKISVPEGLIDADDSIPIIPRGDRDVLQYLVTHMILVGKEDDKAAYWMDRAKAKLRSMIRKDRKQHTHTSLDRGRINPRADQLMRTRRNFL
jgi:hypothetical protein